jgi:hypothetical protein
MRYTKGFAPFAVVLLLGAPSVLAQTKAPTTGREVLERMRAAYAGKWYHTLTFVQKTTRRLPSGSDTVQTWYESLRHTPETGTWLRIDIGHPSEGNGIVSSADSSFPVRGGKLTVARAGGNDFLPLIEGVYVQPVERTEKEIAPTNVDMSHVTGGKWQGRDVWIVGTASASDTTSPQFWVDTQRKVVVRMILARPASSPMDVHLGGYVPLKGGWLATKVEMFVDGVRRQAEEYSDWKADVPLDPGLFSPATWSTAKHWARPER